jgi:hypothetical protein
MKGRSPVRTTDRKGFALAMVVFMLFAAAVAGVTGYQIVSVEASLAEANENTDEALAVANAGVQRYIGEHIGIPGVTTYAAVGDGTVTITPKKVAKLNDSTDLYLLTSVGTVTDPRYPTSPAKRTVQQYANLNRRPLKRLAVFATIQPTVLVSNPNTEVDGRAYFATSKAVDCPAGDTLGVGDIPGIASTGTAVGGSITPLGSQVLLSYASSSALIGATGLRWSVLKDPTFPIPYDGTWPNFASIPFDSFPLIRVNGNYTLDRSGRGVLIVTGNFTDAGIYEWRGVILAGGATSNSYNSGSGNGVTVKGMVVSGLNNSVFTGNQSLSHWHSLYYPCYVRRANLALAYLAPVSRSSWTY